MQPFDIIGNTVVFYSLGNFISNQGDLISSIGYKGVVGVLASMDITKTTYEDGSAEVKVDNIGADLTYTYNKNHRDYKVIPFSNPDIKTYLSDYERVYNKYASVIKNMDNTIEVNSIN